LTRANLLGLPCLRSEVAVVAVLPLSAEVAEEERRDRKEGCIGAHYAGNSGLNHSFSMEAKTRLRALFHLLQRKENARQ